MNLPVIEWRHVRHFDMQVSDKHKFVKEMNQFLAEVFQFVNGECPHRPDEVRLLKDQETNKAAGSVCVWCQQEIEIRKIIWGPKSRFPLPPKAS